MESLIKILNASLIFQGKVTFFAELHINLGGLKVWVKFEFEVYLIMRRTLSSNLMKSFKFTGLGNVKFEKKRGN